MTTVSLVRTETWARRRAAARSVVPAGGVVIGPVVVAVRVRFVVAGPAVILAHAGGGGVDHPDLPIVLPIVLAVVLYAARPTARVPATAWA